MVESIRKWKYATFAVLGVLALIIATPTALAAPSSGGTDISKTVLDILKNSQTLLTQSSSISTTTAATQSAVTNAQTGLPAIQSQIDALNAKFDSEFPAQILVQDIETNFGDPVAYDATSDKPFFVDVCTSVRDVADNSGQLYILKAEELGGNGVTLLEMNIDQGDGKCARMGALPGEILTVLVFSQEGGNARITVSTSHDAHASLTVNHTPD